MQKQHPHDLYHLLSRVIVHLRSKTWETRVAAGLALGCIADNVPVWDPPPCLPGTEINVAQDADGLSFASFSMVQVLEKGQPLVASAGSEFDVDLSEMDPKERLATQKKRLRERLGLGTQFMDGNSS